MSYTIAAVAGVVGAAVLDLVVLRTNLLRRKVFWTSYAIIVGFQLAVNGVLTGRRLVTYSSDDILGPRLEATAPGHVETVRAVMFDPLTAPDVAALGAALTKVREELRRR